MTGSTLRGEVDRLLAAGHASRLVVVGEGGRLDVAPPPPGVFTRLKARLGSLDCFKDRPWAVQARDQIKAATQRQRDAQALLHFRSRLALEYDPGVMDAATRRTPLGRRVVGAGFDVKAARRLMDEAQAAHTRRQANCSAAADAVLRANGATALKMNRTRDESPVYAVAPEHSWPAIAHDAMKAFACALARCLAAEHPASTRRPLTGDEIDEIGTAVGEACRGIVDELKDEPAHKVLAGLDPAVLTCGSSRTLLGAFMQSSLRWLVDDAIKPKWGEGAARPGADMQAVAGMLARHVDAAFGLVPKSGPDGRPVSIADVLGIVQRRRAEVREIVQRHVAALDFIERDEGLNPAQRDMLREMAASQPMDIDMVRMLRKGAERINNAMEAITACLAGGDAAGAFTQLRALCENFDKVFLRLASGAHRVGLAHELMNVDGRNALFDRCIEMALLHRGVDAAAARPWFELLSGQDPRSAQAVPQLMRAADGSPSPHLAALSMRYEQLVFALAGRVGVALDELAEQRAVQVLKPGGIVQEMVPLTWADVLREGLLGPRRTPAELPPRLQDLTVWEAPRGEEGGVATNGSVAFAPHAHWIDPEFDATRAFTAGEADPEPPADAAFAAGFGQTLEQATLSIDGKEVSGDLDARLLALRAALGGGDDDRAARLLRALSRCVNPDAQHRWNGALQAAAFGRAGVTIAADDDRRRLEIHLEHAADGGWTLQLRERYEPTRATTALGEQPLAPGGLVLTARSWHLAEDAAEPAVPVLARRDARTVFFF